MCRILCFFFYNLDFFWSSTHLSITYRCAMVIANWRNSIDISIFQRGSRMSQWISKIYYVSLQIPLLQKMVNPQAWTHFFHSAAFPTLPHWLPWKETLESCFLFVEIRNWFFCCCLDPWCLTSAGPDSLHVLLFYHLYLFFF